MLLLAFMITALFCLCVCVRTGRYVCMCACTGVCAGVYVRVKHAVVIMFEEGLSGVRIYDVFLWACMPSNPPSLGSDWL